MFECLPGDLPYLKEMWKDIFKDSDKTVSALFDNVFSRDKIFTVGHGENIFSMLYYFDVYLKYRNETFKAAYICGVATKADKRSNGYAGGLIEYAVSEIKKKDYDIILLIPATLSLFAFYKKFGFEPFSEINILDAGEAFKFCAQNKDYLAVSEDAKIAAIRKLYGDPEIIGGTKFFKTAPKTLSSEGDVSREAVMAAAEFLGAGGRIISPPSVNYGKNAPLSVAIKLNARKYPEDIYINFLLN